jgi:hypothetical protein
VPVDPLSQMEREASAERHVDETLPDREASREGYVRIKSAR